MSPHCRTAIREADRARRIMYWARQQSSLPKQIDGGLTALHERDPFPYGIEPSGSSPPPSAIRTSASRSATKGIHCFNRDGFLTGDDPFAFFPHLGVEQDGGHAFYLGVELARAQIARQLGKRYVQDQPLQWGCVPEPVTDTDDL